jgi:hypothetical protein
MWKERESVDGNLTVIKYEWEDPKTQSQHGNPGRKEYGKRGSGIMDTCGQRQREAHEDRKISKKGIKIEPHHP